MTGFMSGLLRVKILPLRVLNSNMTTVRITLLTPFGVKARQNLSGKVISYFKIYTS